MKKKKVFAILGSLALATGTFLSAGVPALAKDAEVGEVLSLDETGPLEGQEVNLQVQYNKVVPTEYDSESGYWDTEEVADKTVTATIKGDGDLSQAKVEAVWEDGADWVKTVSDDEKAEWQTDYGTTIEKTAIAWGGIDSAGPGIYTLEIELPTDCERVLHVSEGARVEGNKVIVTAEIADDEWADWMQGFFEVMYVKADGSSGGGESGSTTAQNELINKIVCAGNTPGDQVVEYHGNGTLSAEELKELAKYPNVTLLYFYTYEGKDYGIAIPSGAVVLDEGVEWYGPINLFGKYGKYSVGSKVASGTGVYTVVAGDTLGKLAAKFGTTVKDLAAKNGIKNVNLIYVGQKIKY